MLKGFVDGNSGEEEHYAPPCSKDAALVKIVMDIVLNEGCGDGCIDSHIRGRSERSLSGRTECSLSVRIQKMVPSWRY